MTVSTWSAYHRTSKISKEIFNLSKKVCEVGLNLEDIPEECLHFLENYAIVHDSNIPMVLGAALPLTASLLGPGTGTRLLACHLGPVNFYILNVCAVAGRKTATHQPVINEVIATIEDDPNSINLLLENYMVAGFQVSTNIHPI